MSHSSPLHQPIFYSQLRCHRAAPLKSLLLALCLTISSSYVAAANDQQEQNRLYWDNLLEQDTEVQTRLAGLNTSLEWVTLPPDRQYRLLDMEAKTYQKLRLYRDAERGDIEVQLEDVNAATRFYLHISSDNRIAMRINDFLLADALPMAAATGEPSIDNLGLYTEPDYKSYLNNILSALDKLLGIIQNSEPADAESAAFSEFARGARDTDTQEQLKQALLDLVQAFGTYEGNNHTGMHREFMQNGQQIELQILPYP